MLVGIFLGGKEMIEQITMVWGVNDIILKVFIVSIYKEFAKEIRQIHSQDTTNRE